MKLKDSNIATIFVSSGFPENRSVFYKKVEGENDDVNQICINDNKNDEFGGNDDNDDIDDDDFQLSSKDPIKIEGRDGLYKQSIPVHERYAARPKSLESMCLAQFATSYKYSKNPPKKAVFEEGSSTSVSSQTIFNSEILLPTCISLVPKDLGYMNLRLTPAVLRNHNSSKKEGVEQHYAEMLLFSSWKDEIKDLDRGLDTCFDQYLEKKTEIDLNKKAMFPGESKIDYLEDKEIELASMRPTHIYDTLNSQGEQQNKDDLEVGAVDDPKYESRGYTGNLNLEEGKQFEKRKYRKFCLPNESEMHFMTRRLVPEQMSALRKVIAACKNVVKCRKNPKIKPKPVRLAILGGQGVGKSETIKTIAMHAEKILRLEGTAPKHPNVIVCAFTGKAASLINGITIHSAFNLKFSTEQPALLGKPLAEAQTQLANLKLIIIDEVSMVSSQMLHNINKKLSEIFNTNELTEPFANISIVLVGDLLQLPPVQGSVVFKNVDTWMSQKLSESEKLRLSAFVDSPLWEMFEPIILKHNHRQGEGNAWANSLNNFRRGIVTNEDEALIKTRVTKKKFLEDDCMHVFYLNDDVNHHNETMLDIIPSDKITIIASQKNPTGFKPFVHKKKGTLGQTSFMETLNIKIGARCMLIHNVNVIDYLVNGSTGKIVGIESNSQGKVECIVVQFDNEIWGKEQRSIYHSLSEKYKDVNGTPIFKTEVEYQTKSKNGWIQPVGGKLYQFPIRLAWAQTAHKMQVII